jgi:uncharacterized damage-inducible protein DinB
MIVDIASFLKYFQSIHRRTVRDVGALPEEAETWTPPYGEGEDGWGIPKIVEHIAEARGFFVSAYCGRGWVWASLLAPLERRDQWIPALDDSASRMSDALRDTPPEWMQRKVEPIGGGDRLVAGWRLLMMLTEHEIQHRAQLMTYAGLNGWKVEQTFGRTNEWVVGQRDEELKKRA